MSAVIHVWLARPSIVFKQQHCSTSRELADRYAATIGSSGKLYERITRFRRVEDAERTSDTSQLGHNLTRAGTGTLLGRLMLERLLQSQLGLPLTSCTLEYTAAGRPHLVRILVHQTGDSRLTGLTDTTAQGGTQAMQFNIAHDKDLVALAWTISNVQLGVDVMQDGRVPWSTASEPRTEDIDEFVEVLTEHVSNHQAYLLRVQPLTRCWQLTSDERALMDGSPSAAARLERALTLWTLKEAYVKALGEGLHFPLATVSFTGALEATEGLSHREIMLHGKLLDGWQAYTIKHGGYQIAVAAHSGMDVLLESVDAQVQTVPE